MTKYICVILILLLSFHNGFSDDNIIIVDEQYLNLDKDKIPDKIQILFNKNKESQILHIYFSSDNDKTPSIVNIKAVPNSYLDYIICDEITRDSLGFKFLMMNTNGNNHKSKTFYFKQYKDDIVLHRIDEIRFYDGNFIQEINTTDFVYENVQEYDSIYSIKYFDFRDFW